MKVLVKCTLMVPVEVPDHWKEDNHYLFAIEDNGCPGTSFVGTAIQDMITHCDDKNICWACNFQGENEVVEIMK